MKAVNFYIDGRFGCSIPANLEGKLTFCDAEIAERFWGRHDKEENYRRIGYTNEQFNVMLPGGRPGIPGIPGWLTDRGRIYIAYGPPDAIREIAGDEKNAAAIIWHYSSIPEYGKDVELRFVDVCGCGDYRLQTFPKN